MRDVSLLGRTTTSAAETFLMCLIDLKYYGDTTRARASLLATSRCARQVTLETWKKGFQALDVPPGAQHNKQSKEVIIALLDKLIT